MVQSDALALNFEAKPPLMVEPEHTVALRMAQSDALALALEAKPPLLVEPEHTVALQMAQSDVLALTLEAKPPLLIEIDHTVMTMRLCMAPSPFASERLSSKHTSPSPSHWIAQPNGGEINLNT